jgi:hypothetical protein
MLFILSLTEADKRHLAVSNREVRTFLSITLITSTLCIELVSQIYFNPYSLFGFTLSTVGC